jgi:hypothetical protein
MGREQQAERFLHDPSQLQFRDVIGVRRFVPRIAVRLPLVEVGESILVAIHGEHVGIQDVELVVHDPAVGNRRIERGVARQRVIELSFLEDVGPGNEQRSLLLPLRRGAGAPGGGFHGGGIRRQNLFAARHVPAEAREGLVEVLRVLEQEVGEREQNQGDHSQHHLFVMFADPGHERWGRVRAWVWQPGPGLRRGRPVPGGRS